jgi:hypothetical protein
MSDDRPGEPAGERPEPAPPELGSLWKAIALALLIVGGGICAVYGLWLAFFAFIAAGGASAIGYNK